MSLEEKLEYYKVLLEVIVSEGNTLVGCKQCGGLIINNLRKE
jgi:hypothetical protein